MPTDAAVPGPDASATGDVTIAPDGATNSNPLGTGGALSGIVYAPKGGDVLNAEILACLPTDSGCDDVHSKSTVVTTSGASGAWTIAGLDPGQYLIIAAKDIDLDNALSAGDYLGVYSASGLDVSMVIPPQANLIVAMGVYTPTPPAGSVPADLVGTWHQGSVSPVSFYNPATGSFAPPSGTGQFITFKADGSYVRGSLIQSSLYQCTMSIFTYFDGQATVSGSTLTLNPTSGTLKSTDNCNSSFNYTKPANLTSSTYSYKRANENGLEALYLYDSTGAEVSRLMRE